MNQYHGRLQSIMESEQEYTDLHGVHNRQGSMQGSQYYYDESTMGKILNSKNLNSINQQQSYLNKSQQDNSLINKYLGKSQQQSTYVSQQQPLQQSQFQKNTLPNNTNEDYLTVQNGVASKHFFDENSIDLSFINFLNKDDGQNVTNPVSKGAFTNRNLGPQSVLQSYGQLSSIPNLNTSNNLTQYPSAILGAAKPSQQVQEKYQQGLQNINDLAYLLTSATHTPDRVIQNKLAENNVVITQSNQQFPKKLISQQYDEIMAKYQNILQNSQNDRVNEVTPEQQSPELAHNDSVKINDYSEQIYPISDSHSHSNIGIHAFNQSSEPFTPIQNVEHRRLSSQDFHTYKMSSNVPIDRPHFSPSSRQFTFDQQNDLRGSNLSLNNYNNKFGANSGLTAQTNNQLNLNGYNTGINQQQQQPNLLTNNDIKYNTISKLPTLIEEEKVKKTSNIPTSNYNLTSGGAIDSTTYGLYSNYLQPSSTQQPSVSITHQYSNTPNQLTNQATNLNLTNQPSTQTLTNQQTSNLNSTQQQNTNYIPSSYLPPLATPSLKSQQYDQIVAKYLPKGSTSQPSIYQNVYNSQLSQASSVQSSMIGNNGGLVNQSHANNNQVNQSTDSKSVRERSNSINKLATARELLENFSASKKQDSQYSPQPRQPLGLLQNNLANSQLTERFNSLSSAQKMKDSNAFQNLGLKESNGFVSNFNQNDYKNSQYISTQQMLTQQTQQDELSGGVPQYKPLYVGNTITTTDNNAPRNSFYNTNPLTSNQILQDIKAQTYNYTNSRAGTAYSSSNENVNQYNNKRLSFDKPTAQAVPTTESTQPNFSTYNQNYGLTDFGLNKNQIQLPPTTSITPLNNYLATPSSSYIGGFGTVNNTPSNNNYLNNLQVFQSTTSTAGLNSQPFTRTNNHMASLTTYQPLQGVPNAESRRQSGYSEQNKQLLQTATDNPSSLNRKPSAEKAPLLDAKTLLQQRDEQIKQSQLPNSQFPLQQQPIQQQLQQQPVVQQQQPTIQQSQLPTQQQQQFLQQNQQQFQALPQQNQFMQTQQQPFVSNIPIINNQQQTLSHIPFTPVSERPSSRPTIYSNANKDMMIPGTISPISTPTHSKQNLQLNLDNDLELEFHEFVNDLQTKKPQESKETVKRTLKPSQSQPFLQTFNFGQNEFQSENKNNQADMVASLSKPKRKIFEDNKNSSQKNNKTLKMNQQMLKNVLNFTKPVTNHSNEPTQRVKTESNLSTQGQETYLVKEILFQNEQLNNEFKRTHNSFNPTRPSNNNSNLPPLQSKYIIPPKVDSPVKSYQQLPSSSNLQKENGPLMPSSHNNLDKSSIPQNRATSMMYTNKKETSPFTTDYKNHNNKKQFNIFDKSNATPSYRQTEYIENPSNYRPTEYDRQSHQKQASKTNGFQQKVDFKEDAKDMIRTIKSDDELEENVKRTKLSKSKSTAKIFTNSPKNSEIPQSIQVTTPFNSFTPIQQNEPSRVGKFSHTSNSRPMQSYNNYNPPVITQNDRMTLQIAEQKIQSTVQDITTFAIPILCINCDRFYEQRDIETHVCVPAASNQNKGHQYDFRNASHTYQNDLTEEQFITEDNMVNDKIRVIYDKISEQPSTNESLQIKQLLERILKSNLSLEGLIKECRSLSHLNKTVENIKSRAGLSLLILSQRSEVLLKDKIDIHKRRQGVNTTYANNNTFNINSASNLNNVSEHNVSHNQPNQQNPASTNRSNFQKNTNNLNINSVNQPSDFVEVTEMNFNYNKTERVQTERMTANPNNTIPSTNRLLTNNSPNVQTVQTQKFLETPSSQASNANLFSNSKNKIFSPPVTKIFTYNNIIPEINTNMNTAAVLPNYNEQVEVESTTNYSKKKYGFNHQVQNDDVLSQYSSSVASMESNNMLKQYNKSTSLIKFNESTVQSQQKRQFYNIALNLKLKLPVNHPARDCIISEMFTQAEKQNISENNYQQYIESYFKQFKN